MKILENFKNRIRKKWGDQRLFVVPPKTHKSLWFKASLKESSDTGDNNGSSEISQMIAHKGSVICCAGVKLRNKLHKLLLSAIWYPWSAKEDEDHDGASDGVDNGGDDRFIDGGAGDACGDYGGGDNSIHAGSVDHSDYVFKIWFVTLQ